MSNHLTDTEKTLIAALKKADLSTQLKVACNLAKAGHFDLIGLAGIHGLVEAVGKALRAEGEILDIDKSKSVNVPLTGGLS